MKTILFFSILLMAAIFIVKADAQMVIALSNHEVEIYSSNGIGAPYEMGTLNRIVNMAANNDIKAQQAEVVADATYQTWSEVQTEAINAVANYNEAQ